LPCCSLAILILAFVSCAGGPTPAASRHLVSAPAPATIRFSFRNGTEGLAAGDPAYLVFTARDASGGFCRLDRTGTFVPCSTADNVIPKDGRAWCDYAIPMGELHRLDLPPGLRLDSARVYFSVGSPLYLRVDEKTGGLVQPDPANPSDPNAGIRYDWIELALDDTGFHGNTTSVDQYGLSVALSVVDRTDPDHPLGPVGITESRSALFAAWRTEMPPDFAALADAQDLRILAPAHGTFQDAGTHGDYLRAYIDQMWARYRAEPLVLTPDQGTFTGRVDAQDRIVFTREGDPAAYVIAGKPTTQEAFLGNGVLAQGNSLEKVLGAQIAALLNRHLLETPQAWRDASAYYRQAPCNSYAAFWHRHGLGGKAYGFAYDDVNDQSSSLAARDPQEIRVVLRWD
jgi:hypothetical protein